MGWDGSLEKCRTDGAMVPPVYCLSSIGCLPIDFSDLGGDPALLAEEAAAGAIRPHSLITEDILYA